MAKYSKKAQDKVGDVMEEFKEGKLKSGSGRKVTSRKQAIAIGISEARESGAKVPKRKSGKNTATKKAAGKKAAARKTGTKKTATKKAATKKTPNKKSAVKKQRQKNLQRKSELQRNQPVKNLQRKDQQQINKSKKSTKNTCRNKKSLQKYLLIFHKNYSTKKIQK